MLRTLLWDGCRRLSVTTGFAQTPARAAGGAAAICLSQAMPGSFSLRTADKRRFAMVLFGKVTERSQERKPERKAKAAGWKASRPNNRPRRAPWIYRSSDRRQGSRVLVGTFSSRPSPLKGRPV